MTVGHDRDSAFTRRALATITISISSGKTTRRDFDGKNPLYGSTGRIGSTNSTEFTGPSILVARVGANAGSVYSVDGSYGVTDNTLVVRPAGGQDPSFLSEVLQYADLNRMVYGSGQPLVTGTMLKRLEVPDLPPAEQHRVAEALLDASNLIAALRRKIAKAQAVKQGVMQELLTGRKRLPGFNGPWATRRLADLLGYEQPSKFLVQTTKQLDRGRIPVLTAGKTFVLGYTNDADGIYTAHPVIIFDDFTTASKYVDFEFKAKSSAMKILSAKPHTNLRFVFERMQMIDFPLGDHKRYWISEYSKQEISVPDVAEQNAVARVLADADLGVAALRGRLSKAKAIKRGMMQDLLTGRTRLRTAEALS